MMNTYFVAITGTKGYISKEVVANSKENAIKVAIENFENKGFGKVKKVFAKNA